MIAYVRFSLKADYIHFTLPAPRQKHALHDF